MSKKSPAFRSKPSLNKNFRQLNELRISQTVLSRENPKTDVPYLRKLFKKLREADKLKILHFSFVMNVKYVNFMSRTLQKISFAQFLWIRTLVELYLSFDDILKKQKIVLWKVIEQNFETVRKVRFTLYSNKASCFPHLASSEKISLESLEIKQYATTNDLFLIALYKNKLKIEHLVIQSIEFNSFKKCEVAYFLDMVVRCSLMGGLSTSMKYHLKKKFGPEFLSFFNEQRLVN